MQMFPLQTTIATLFMTIFVVHTLFKSNSAASVRMSVHCPHFYMPDLCVLSPFDVELNKIGRMTPV